MAGQAPAWLRAGMTRKRGPADDIQRRDAGNGGKSQSPRSLSSDCPAAVLLRAWPYRAHHLPTRPHIHGAGWSDERIPIPVAISRRPYACTSLLVSFHAEAARQSARRQHFGQPEPDREPSQSSCHRMRVFERNACPSSGSSTWAFLFSWPEDHLHAAVFLVAEGFVHAGAVLEVHAMRHDERRVDLSFLDPA